MQYTTPIRVLCFEPVDEINMCVHLSPHSTGRYWTPWAEKIYAKSGHWDST